jgi:hypothetical protein
MTVGRHQCASCGQQIPLGVWLRAQKRTLWTTADLIERYGGSAHCIGRELKRLGAQTVCIRLRLPGGSLSKKRAVYCVTPSAFAAFNGATPTQLRSQLARERHAEILAKTYVAMADLYTDETIPPIVKDRLAHLAATFKL